MAVMNPPDGPPLADAMRRIEDAFTEGGERPRGEPSADAVRAAEALLFAGGEPVTAKALGEKLGEGVDVVWPAVQQNDRRTVGRAHVDVADFEEAGRDLLDGAEGAAQPFWLCC